MNQLRSAPTRIPNGANSFDHVTVFEASDRLGGKILTGEFEFSRHAVDQSILRVINVAEVQEARLDRIVDGSKADQRLADHPQSLDGGGP